MIEGVLLAAAVLVADACPADRVLHGAPETSVAGIDIDRDELTDAFDRFGRPGKIKWVHEDRVDASWAKYKWTRGETALGVSARGDTLQIVQVSGDPSDRIPGTGRGLKLGDPMDRVEALYGTTFVEGVVTGPEIGDRTVTYCFDAGTELSVGLDPSGRVIAIRLTAPQR